MLALPLHSYRAETDSTARLVNMFAEAAPQGARGPITARRAPGILSHADAGNGPGRGMHPMRDVLYALSGATFYRIVGRIAQSIGTIPGTDRAFMADNGTQLAIITTAGGWIYEAGSLTKITDDDFTTRNPGPCAFLDNYLLVVDRGTGQFFSSDLADFSNFIGTDFATAEAHPDNVITLEVDHRMALLLGTQSGELWENVGGSGFAFQRISNGVFELGVVSETGVGKQDNSVFWVANDLTLRRLTGNTPTRVSQHGMERAMRRYSRVDDVQLFPYTVDGHLCMIVNFPSAEATWVYDATTQECHEREGIAVGTHLDAMDTAEVGGVTYIQRATTGEVGILSPTTYTQWGDTLRAEWAYQPVYDHGNRITIHQLEMGIETGVGLESGQGSDPLITLQWSRDSGREGTFRAEAIKSLGPRGNYRTRVKWHRLGAGRDTVFRASCSEPVALTVWDTQTEAEALAA